MPIKNSSKKVKSKSHKRSQRRSHKRSQRRSHKRSQRRSHKKSQRRSHKGGGITGRVQIETHGGKVHKYVCKICNNTIFDTQRTLLPRGSRLWDYFLGDTFDKGCRVFKCTNCGNINWFSKSVMYRID